MRERIESVMLEGASLRVTARPPLPGERPVLAVATAMRVLARFPVIREVVIVSDGSEMRVSREQIERILQPEGFTALRDPGRRRELTERAVQELPPPPPAPRG